jgi:beta-ribofuranosylaminobenzene 5'-phosphate synthase
MMEMVLKSNLNRGLVITTPSRLHFGLIDLNGEYGRIDGGSGVSLSDPCWELEFKPSDSFSFETNDQTQPEIVKKLDIQRIFNSFDHLSRKCSVNVKAAIPSHVGLGSHTQLNMALVRGITAMNGIELADGDLIRKSGRGGTSGIGIQSFLRGGFICDLGHSFGPESEKQSFLPSSASEVPGPPPVLLHEEIPVNWYFIVALPNVSQGSSGLEEVNIFKEYCPISSSEVEMVSRILLMKILPGILQKDIHGFGKGLFLLQKTGFKRIEIELQDPIIKALLSEAKEVGATGAGMSSFGPATYALTDNRDHAEEIKKKLSAIIEKGPGGDIFITRTNNTGANLTYH